MDPFKVSQAIDVPKQTETEDASNPALICSRRRWRTVIQRKKERIEVEVVEDRASNRDTEYEPEGGYAMHSGITEVPRKRVSATSSLNRTVQYFSPYNCPPTPKYPARRYRYKIIRWYA